jgi:RNA polymerase sigma factor (sigma-70 family)
MANAAAGHGVGPTPRAGMLTRDADDDLADLQVPLRRYVAARVPDAHRVDDVVQETLLRMLEVRQRLEVETQVAYALTIARNLIYAGARSEATARRALPRLHHPQEPQQPDDVATSAEARRALAAALANLPPHRRALLVEHEVEDQPLSELAERRSVKPGVLASQLHRTRAALRVDYVVALRRATLPTRSCRSVLMAISVGDGRQQAALSAGEHLLSCPVCADLAPPLLRRDRSLAGLVPWVPLGAPHGFVEGWVRGHPVSSAAAAASAVAAVAAVALLTPGSSAPPATPAAAPTTPATATTTTTTAPTTTTTAPTTTTPTTAPPPPPATARPVPRLTSQGRPVIATREDLAPLTSRLVAADQISVVSVPANEGFWAGDAQSRIWVQLTGSGESPVAVRPGMVLTFTGQVVANTPSFLAGTPLTPGDKATLTDAGYHVDVDSAAMRVVR